MRHLIAAVLAAVAAIGALAGYFLLQAADGYVRLLGMLVCLSAATALVGAFIMLAASPNRPIAWIARAVLALLVIGYAVARIGNF